MPTLGITATTIEGQRSSLRLQQ